MAALLLTLIQSKLFIEIAGGLTALIAIYLKGYFHGKGITQDRYLQYAAKAQDEVLKTETQNIQIDQARQDATQKVDDASGTINELIGVWNELNKKADSNPPQKKP